MIRQAQLSAWILENDIEYKLVNIPSISKTKYVSVCKDQVWIVTEEDIINWPIDQNANVYLVHVIAPGLTPEAVLIHPTSQDTVILFSSCKINSTYDKVTMRLTAKIHANSDVQPCSFDIPLASKRKDKGNLLFDIRPINNNGLYSVSWIMPGSIDLSNIPLACSSRHNDKDALYYRLLLSYDVYSHHFVLRCFGQGASEGVADGVQLHLQPEEFAHESHVWADRMLAPVIDVGSVSRHFLFQTVMAHDQVPRKPPCVRYICGIRDPQFVELEKGSIVNLKGHNEGLLSYFTYEMGASPLQELWTESNNWDRKICGVETFLVLFAELGWVVWCFDKRIVLPSIKQMPKDFLLYHP